MAQRGQKDLIARLADAGEEALARLAATPGMERAFGAMSTMRDQVDALGQKVRGLEDLERRLAALEKKVDRMGGASTSRKTTTSRKTSTTARKKSSTTRKKS